MNWMILITDVRIASAALIVAGVVGLKIAR